MRNLIIIILIVLETINISAQNNSLIINTNDYMDIITDNNGNFLAINVDYNINYNFYFTKNEIKIIKNFTGDLTSEIYKVKSYKVKNGIILFKTDNGNIELDIYNETIIIEKEKNYITCYYIDNQKDEQINFVLNDN